MYWKLVLDPAPPLHLDDAELLLRTAVDPDAPESARVTAFHRLRGLERAESPDARAHRREIARSLVHVLNEPLLWLGSEAHACLCSLDDTLAIGLDARGLIAASGEDEGSLERDAQGQRHCPVLGPVEALPHVAALLPRLPAPLPWLCAPPAGGALFAVFDDDGGFVRKIWVQEDCTLGAGSFTARLPGRSRASMRVMFHDGRLLVRKGHDGPGPSLGGGAPLEAAGEGVAALGDVIGLDPWRLRVVAVVPPPREMAGGDAPGEVRVFFGGETRTYAPLRLGMWVRATAFAYVARIAADAVAFMDLRSMTATAFVVPLDAEPMEVGPWTRVARRHR